MFSDAASQLRTDVETIKKVIDVHEVARGLFYGPTAAPDGWSSIRANAPEKIQWQTYDHCAAFTRLYAMYSAFVEDVVWLYLRLLPALYPNYRDLPEGVLKQHRLGCAHILQKLGESGRYGHLTELELVKTFASGVVGNSGYVLQRDAFFIDRQNYRLDALGRLLAYLGIEDGATRLSRHPKLLAFCEERKPEATSVQSELSEFVRIRNEAAHSQVDEIVSVAEFKDTADFVILLCECLSDVLDHSVVEQQVERKELPEIGSLIETYKEGGVGILKAKPNLLATGDWVVVVNKLKQCRLIQVLSIQVDDKPVEKVDCQDGQEIGLGFNAKVKKGLAVFKAVMLSLPAMADVKEPTEEAPTTSLGESEDDGEVAEATADEAQDGA